MVTEINWKFLSDAIDFYKDLGYQYVEVPWIADKDIIDITVPKHIQKKYQHDLVFSLKDHNNRALVGSAEQSFLHMLYKKNLIPGKYVACTPCFRNENVDILHQKTFMKVELFVSVNNTTNLPEGINFIIKDAENFFSQYVSRKEVKRVDVDTNMVDLEIAGIEVGSYGYRETKDLKWIYGTGVAEPRFSLAKNTLINGTIYAE